MIDEHVVDSDQNTCAIGAVVAVRRRKGSAGIHMCLHCTKVASGECRVIRLVRLVFTLPVSTFIKNTVFAMLSRLAEQRPREQLAHRIITKKPTA